MSTRTKYTVWVWLRRDDAGVLIPRENRVWEVSESGCTIKQAERIAREVKHDFGVPTRILPESVVPTDLRLALGDGG